MINLIKCMFTFIWIYFYLLAVAVVICFQMAWWCFCQLFDWFVFKGARLVEEELDGTND